MVEVGEALVRGGVSAFEITLNSDGAIDGIAALARRFGRHELLVGAGTVLSQTEARTAIDAGAQFLVMPHTDELLVAWASERGVPTFPGAFSPTEIFAAWQAGAAGVKLFPASVAGPAFIRELRGPFPQIPLIATGGVTLESAPAFVSAGAIGVGMGSWLTGGGIPSEIEARARDVVRAVRQAREGIVA